MKRNRSPSGVRLTAGLLLGVACTSLAAAAQGAETRSFQAGDGNPYSVSFDWRLMEGYPDLSATLWTENVLVGRDDSAAFEHRVLLCLPDLIGAADGQIPEGAVILGAELALLANEARGVPIAVRRVLEPNLGFAGQAIGKYTERAPTWKRRTLGTPWAQPGAGWPASSAAVALDTVTVTETSSWVTFDVSAAVQAWVTDPSTNHGLLFSSPDLTTPGQWFKGGSVDGPRRPILTVTWDVPRDGLGPDVEITSPPSWIVPVAFVEGTNGLDAVDVTMRIDGGRPVPVERTTPGRWFRRVTIGSTRTTVEVTAVDAQGFATTATQVLTVTPVDLSLPGPVVLAAGEMVHLFAPAAPGCTHVRYDTGTGADPEEALDGFETGWMAYELPGQYTARATFLDRAQQELGTMEREVLVVATEELRPVVAQAGYPVEVAFDVQPGPSAAPHLFFRPEVPAALFVKSPQLEDGRLTVAGLGNDLEPTRLEVRIGGVEGRRVDTVVVHPFLLWHEPTPNGKLAAFDFVMHVTPKEVLEVAPDLLFKVRIFSDGSAFQPPLDPDGDRVVVVGTEAFAPDGSLTMGATHDWNVSPEFCRAFQPLAPPPLTADDPPPADPVGEDKPENGGGQKECDLAVKVTGGTDTAVGCERVFHAQRTGGEAPFTYRWKLGYWWLFDSYGWTSGSEYKVFEFNGLGNETVRVRVTDKHGCVAEGSHVIHVHDWVEFAGPPETESSWGDWKLVAPKYTTDGAFETVTYTYKDEASTYYPELGTDPAADWDLVSWYFPFETVTSPAGPLNPQLSKFCWFSNTTVGLYERPRLKTESGEYQKWDCFGKDGDPGKYSYTYAESWQVKLRTD